jgi:hypothetical protein
MTDSPDLEQAEPVDLVEVPTDRNVQDPQAACQAAAEEPEPEPEAKP